VGLIGSTCTALPGRDVPYCPPPVLDLGPPIRRFDPSEFDRMTAPPVGGLDPVCDFDRTMVAPVGGRDAVPGREGYAPTFKVWQILLAAL
jgi:hypothetical protein